MMVKQVAPCNPLSVSYSLLDVSARPRGGTTGVQVSWILLRFCFLAHRGQRTERFSETKIQINIEKGPGWECSILLRVTPLRVTY